MRAFSKTLKAISLVTLFCFVSTQISWGATADGMNVSRAITDPELAFAWKLQIPEQLGAVSQQFGPTGSESRTVVLIENAHANFDAQMKVRELLRYLDQTYGVKTVFVEGAAEKLDPARLDHFSDPKLNLQLAEYLAKQGILSGAGLYLAEHSKGIQGLGIEDVKLYRANYEALRTVFGESAKIEKLLAKMETRLSALLSKQVSVDLKRSLEEWQRFEKGRREFLPFVNQLRDEAKAVLGLDMKNAFSQLEWSQMVRLLALQELEGKLDLKAAAAERTRLIQFLRSKHASKETLAVVEAVFGDAPVAAAVDCRQAFEDLLKAARPKGLQLKDWPAFTAFAAHRTLKQELDAPSLFKEIERLFREIADAQAKTPEAKKLVALHRDLSLFSKLMRLELSREEYSLVRERKITSEGIMNRLNGDPGAKRNGPRPVDRVFAAALSFYEFADKREQGFYERIDRQMRERNITKAVVVTGGFHTQGIGELLRAKGSGSAVITPHIAEASDNRLYKNAMLGQPAKTVAAAFLDAAQPQQSAGVVASLRGTDYRAEIQAAMVHVSGVQDAGKLAAIMHTQKQSPGATSAESQLRSELRVGPAGSSAMSSESSGVKLIRILQDEGFLPKDVPDEQLVTSVIQYLNPPADDKAPEALVRQVALLEYISGPYRNGDIRDRPEWEGHRVYQTKLFEREMQKAIDKGIFTGDAEIAKQRYAALWDAFTAFEDQPGHVYYHDLTNVQNNRVSTRLIRYVLFGDPSFDNEKEWQEIADRANQMARVALRGSLFTEALASLESSVTDEEKDHHLRRALLMALHATAPNVRFSDPEPQKNFDETVARTRAFLSEALDKTLALDSVGAFVREVLTPRPSGHPLKAVYFVDDNGDLIFHLYLIQSYLAMNPRLEVALVAKSERVAIDTKLSDIEHELEMPEFKRLKAELGRRLHLVRKGPVYGGVNLDNASRELVEAVRDSDVVIGLGQMLTENMNGILKPAYHQAYVDSKYHQRATGLSKASLYFVRVPAGKKYYSHYQDDARLVTLNDTVALGRVETMAELDRIHQSSVSKITRSESRTLAATQWRDVASWSSRGVDAVTTTNVDELVKLAGDDRYWVRIVALSRLAEKASQKDSEVWTHLDPKDPVHQEVKVILEAYLSVTKERILSEIRGDQKEISDLLADTKLSDYRVADRVEKRFRETIERRERLMGYEPGRIEGYPVFSRWGLGTEQREMAQDPDGLWRVKVTRSQTQTVRPIIVWQFIADMALLTENLLSKQSENPRSLASAKELLEYIADLTATKEIEAEISIPGDKKEREWMQAAFEAGYSPHNGSEIVKMGAVLVSKDGRLIGAGYNGAPSGQLTDTVVMGGDIRKDDLGKKGLKDLMANDAPGYTAKHENGAFALDIRDNRPDLRRSICAEQRAILSALLRGEEVQGSTLYTVASPCNQCAEMALNLGVGRVSFAKQFKDRFTDRMIEESAGRIGQLADYSPRASQRDFADDSHDAWKRVIERHGSEPMCRLNLHVFQKRGYVRLVQSKIWDADQRDPLNEEERGQLEYVYANIEKDPWLSTPENLALVLRDMVTVSVSREYGDGYDYDMQALSAWDFGRAHRNKQAFETMGKMLEINPSVFTWENRQMIEAPASPVRHTGGDRDASDFSETFDKAIAEALALFDKAESLRSQNPVANARSESRMEDGFFRGLSAGAHFLGDHVWLTQFSWQNYVLPFVAATGVVAVFAVYLYFHFESFRQDLRERSRKAKDSFGGVMGIMWGPVFAVALLAFVFIGLAFFSGPGQFLKELWSSRQEAWLVLLSVLRAATNLVTLSLGIAGAFSVEALFRTVGRYLAGPNPFWAEAKLLRAVDPEAPEATAVRAAQVLGEVRSISSVPGLVQVIRRLHYTGALAVAIARTLRSIDDPRGVIPANIALLIDYGEKKAAREFLIRSGSPAVAELISALKSGVSKEVIGILKTIGDLQAVPALINELDTQNAFLRESVAEALGDFKDARAVPALIRLLDEGKESENVAFALLKINDPRGITPAHLAIISLQGFALRAEGSLRYLSARAVRVEESVRYLAALGDEVLPLIEKKLLANRVAHADMLAKIGTPKALDTLLRVMADKSATEYVRRAAAEALGQSKDLSIVPAMLAALDDPVIGESITKALGTLKDPRAVPFLVEKLKRPSVAVANALLEINPRGLEPLHRYLRWISDPPGAPRYSGECNALSSVDVEVILAALKSGTSFVADYDETPEELEYPSDEDQPSDPDVPGPSASIRQYASLRVRVGAAVAFAGATRSLGQARSESRETVPSGLAVRRYYSMASLEAVLPLASVGFSRIVLIGFGIFAGLWLCHWFATNVLSDVSSGESTASKEPKEFDVETLISLLSKNSDEVLAHLTDEFLKQDEVLTALAETTDPKFLPAKEKAVKIALAAHGCTNQYGRAGILAQPEAGQELLRRLGADVSVLDEHRRQVEARRAIEAQLPKNMYGDISKYDIAYVMKLVAEGKTFHVDYDEGDEGYEGMMAADGDRWGEREPRASSIQVFSGPREASRSESRVESSLFAGNDPALAYLDQVEREGVQWKGQSIFLKDLDKSPRAKWTFVRGDKTLERTRSEHIRLVAQSVDAVLRGDYQAWEKVDPVSGLSEEGFARLSAAVARLSTRGREMLARAAALHDHGSYQLGDLEAHQAKGEEVAREHLAAEGADPLMAEAVSKVVLGHSDPWNLSKHVKDTRLKAPFLMADGVSLRAWTQSLLERGLLQAKDAGNFLSELQTVLWVVGTSDVNASGDRGSQLTDDLLEVMRSSMTAIFDVAAFDASTYDEMNRIRQRVQAADVVVLLPFFNEIHDVAVKQFNASLPGTHGQSIDIRMLAGSVKESLEAELKKHGMGRALVFCVGETKGVMAQEVLAELKRYAATLENGLVKFEVYGKEARYAGLAGKKWATRLAMKMAQGYGAHLVSIDGDMTLTPEQISRFMEPVLSGQAHYVSPQYIRYYGKDDIPIIDHLVYPFSVALFGPSVRMPNAGEYVASKDLLQGYLDAMDIWAASLLFEQQFAVRAGQQGRKAVDVWIDEKMHKTASLEGNLDPYLKVALDVFSQQLLDHPEWLVTGSELARSDAQASFLPEAQGDLPARQIFAGVNGLDRKAWLGSAKKEYETNKNQYAAHFPEAVPALERLAASGDEGTLISSSEWALLALQFLKRYSRAGPAERPLLRQLFIPVFRTRIATFIHETESLSQQKAESLILQQALDFKAAAAETFSNPRSEMRRGEELFLIPLGVAALVVFFLRGMIALAAGVSGVVFSTLIHLPFNVTETLKDYQWKYLRRDSSAAAMTLDERETAARARLAENEVLFSGVFGGTDGSMEFTIDWDDPAPHSGLIGLVPNEFFRITRVLDFAVYRGCVYVAYRHPGDPSIVKYYGWRNEASFRSLSASDLPLRVRRLFDVRFEPKGSEGERTVGKDTWPAPGDRTNRLWALYDAQGFRGLNPQERELVLAAVKRIPAYAEELAQVLQVNAVDREEFLGNASEAACIGWGAMVKSRDLLNFLLYSKQDNPLAVVDGIVRQTMISKTQPFENSREWRRIIWKEAMVNLSKILTSEGFLKMEDSSKRMKVLEAVREIPRYAKDASQFGFEAFCLLINSAWFRSSLEFPRKEKVMAVFLEALQAISLRVGDGERWRFDSFKGLHEKGLGGIADPDEWIEILGLCKKMLPEAVDEFDGSFYFLRLGEIVGSELYSGIKEVALRKAFLGMLKFAIPEIKTSLNDWLWHLYEALDAIAKSGDGAVHNEFLTVLSGFSRSLYSDESDVVKTRESLSAHRCIMNLGGKAKAFRATSPSSPTRSEMREGDERYDARSEARSPEITVTGASGDLGAWLGRYIDARGHSFKLVMRSHGAKEKYRARALRNPPENALWLSDLFDCEKMRAVIAQSTVFYHLAALVGLDKDASTYPENFKVNGLAAIGLLKMAEELNPNLRFIFASTQRVYEIEQDPAANRWVDSALEVVDQNPDLFQRKDYSVAMDELMAKILEKSPFPEKMYPYELAKLFVEKYMRRSSLKNTVAARISSIYGPGNLSGRKIQRMIEARLLGKKIEERREIRDYIYIQDVVEILYQLGIREKLPKRSVIDLASGAETSAEDLWKIIEKHTPEASGEMMWKGELILANPQDARAGAAILGRPFTHIETGVRNQIDEIRWRLAAGTPKSAGKGPVLVIDAGGTSTRMAVWDGGKLTDPVKFPTPNYASPEARGRSIEQMQSIWIDALGAKIREYRARHLELQTISVGFAGPVGEEGDLTESSVIWGPEKHKIPNAMLAKSWGLPVKVVNDLTAAVYRYGRSPKFSGMRKIALVTVSSGIGSKVFDVVHGEVIIDPKGRAGEIGHTIVDYSGSALPGEGLKGELNAYASGRGLASLAKRLAAQKKFKDLYQRSALKRELDRRGRTIDEVERDVLTPILVQLIKEKDQFSVQVMKASIGYLVRVLGPFILQDAPEAIVWMGSIVENLDRLYLDELIDQLIKKGLYGYSREDLQKMFVLGEKDDENGLRGAGMMVVSNDTGLAADKKSYEPGFVRDSVDNRGHDMIEAVAPNDLQQRNYFSENVFDPQNHTLADVLENRNAIFIVEKAVAGMVVEPLKRYIADHHLKARGEILVLEGGERIKSAEQVESLTNYAQDQKLDRNGVFVVIGGGAVMDMVGMVANQFRRGVRYVRIPTTLLGQVDAGVGVKVGIDYRTAKNFLGAFYPPYATITDTTFLNTLPARQVQGGIAEIIKVALISNPGLFETLEKYGADFVRDMPEDARRVFVKDSAVELLRHLQLDFFEHNLMRHVDFGHVLAHKFESMTDYDLSHGEAVAIDILMSSFIAHERGMLSDADFQRIISLHTKLKLPFYHPALNPDRAWEGLEEAKAHKGGRLMMVVPIGIGRTAFVDSLRRDELDAALGFLRRNQEQVDDSVMTHEIDEDHPPVALKNLGRYLNSLPNDLTYHWMEIGNALGELVTPAVQKVINVAMNQGLDPQIREKAEAMLTRYGLHSDSSGSVLTLDSSSAPDLKNVRFVRQDKTFVPDLPVHGRSETEIAQELLDKDVFAFGLDDVLISSKGLDPEIVDSLIGLLKRHKTVALVTPRGLTVEDYFEHLRKGEGLGILKNIFEHPDFKPEMLGRIFVYSGVGTYKYGFRMKHKQPSWFNVEPVLQPKFSRKHLKDKNFLPDDQEHLLTIKKAMLKIENEFSGEFEFANPDRDFEAFSRGAKLQSDERAILYFPRSKQGDIENWKLRIMMESLRTELRQALPRDFFDALTFRVGWRKRIVVAKKKNQYNEALQDLEAMGFSREKIVFSGNEFLSDGLDGSLIKLSGLTLLSSDGALPGNVAVLQLQPNPSDSGPDRLKRILKAYFELLDGTPRSEMRPVGDEVMRALEGIRLDGKPLDREAVREISLQVYRREAEFLGSFNPNWVLRSILGKASGEGISDDEIRRFFYDGQILPVNVVFHPKFRPAEMLHSNSPKKGVPVTGMHQPLSVVAGESITHALLEQVRGTPEGQRMFEVMSRDPERSFVIGKYNAGLVPGVLASMELSMPMITLTKRNFDAFQPALAPSQKLLAMEEQHMLRTSPEYFSRMVVPEGSRFFLVDDESTTGRVVVNISDLLRIGGSILEGAAVVLRTSIKASQLLDGGKVPYFYFDFLTEEELASVIFAPERQHFFLFKKPVDLYMAPSETPATDRPVSRKVDLEMRHYPQQGDASRVWTDHAFRGMTMPLTPQLMRRAGPLMQRQVENSLGDLAALRREYYEKGKTVYVVGPSTSGLYGALALSRASHLPFVAATNRPEPEGYEEMASPAVNYIGLDGYTYSLYRLQPGDAVVLVTGELTDGEEQMRMITALEQKGVKVLSSLSMIENVNYAGRKRLERDAGVPAGSLEQYSADEGIPLRNITDRAWASLKYATMNVEEAVRKINPKASVKEILSFYNSLTAGIALDQSDFDSTYIVIEGVTQDELRDIQPLVKLWLVGSGIKMEGGDRKVPQLLSVEQKIKIWDAEDRAGLAYTQLYANGEFLEPQKQVNRGVLPLRAISNKHVARIKWLLSLGELDPVYVRDMIRLGGTSPNSKWWSKRTEALAGFLDDFGKRRLSAEALHWAGKMEDVFCSGSQTLEVAPMDADSFKEGLRELLREGLVRIIDGRLVLVWRERSASMSDSYWREMISVPGHEALVAEVYAERVRQHRVALEALQDWDEDTDPELVIMKIQSWPGEKILSEDQKALLARSLGFSAAVRAAAVLAMNSRPEEMLSVVQADLTRVLDRYSAVELKGKDASIFTSRTVRVCVHALIMLEWIQRGALTADEAVKFLLSQVYPEGADPRVSSLVMRSLLRNLRPAVPLVTDEALKDRLQFLSLEYEVSLPGMLSVEKLKTGMALLAGHERALEGEAAGKLEEIEETLNLFREDLRWISRVSASQSRESGAKALRETLALAPFKLASAGDRILLGGGSDFQLSSAGLWESLPRPKVLSWQAITELLRKKDVFVFDVDDTLVTLHEYISPEMIRHLIRLLREGKTVAIDTLRVFKPEDYAKLEKGRGLGFLKSLFEDPEFKAEYASRFILYSTGAGHKFSFEIGDRGEVKIAEDRAYFERYGKKRRWDGSELGFFEDILRTLYELDRRWQKKFDLEPTPETFEQFISEKFRSRTAPMLYSPKRDFFVNPQNKMPRWQLRTMLADLRKSVAAVLPKDFFMKLNFGNPDGRVLVVSKKSEGKSAAILDLESSGYSRNRIVVFDDEFQSDGVARSFANLEGLDALSMGKPFPGDFRFIQTPYEEGVLLARKTERILRNFFGDVDQPVVRSEMRHGGVEALAERLAVEPRVVAAVKKYLIALGYLRASLARAVAEISEIQAARTREGSRASTATQMFRDEQQRDLERYVSQHGQYMPNLPVGFSSYGSFMEEPTRGLANAIVSTAGILTLRDLGENLDHSVVVVRPLLEKLRGEIAAPGGWDYDLIRYEMDLATRSEARRAGIRDGILAAGLKDPGATEVKASRASAVTGDAKENLVLHGKIEMPAPVILKGFPIVDRFAVANGLDVNLKGLREAGLSDRTLAAVAHGGVMALHATPAEILQSVREVQAAMGRLAVAEALKRFSVAAAANPDLMLAPSDSKGGLLVPVSGTPDIVQLARDVFGMVLNTGVRKTYLSEGVSEDTARSMLSAFAQVKDLSGRPVLARLEIVPVMQGEMIRAVTSAGAAMAYRLGMSPRDVVVLLEGPTYASVREKIAQTVIVSDLSGSTDLVAARDYLAMGAAMLNVRLDNDAWALLNQKVVDALKKRDGFFEVDRDALAGLAQMLTQIFAQDRVTAVAA